jgi:hypothetical protein
MSTENKRGDIHKNYFCSTAGMSDCPDKGNCAICPDCHRKWPTPETFKQEYGVEYPNEAAVYIRLKDHTGWLTTVKELTKDGRFFYWSQYLEVVAIVCACTPWGKPPEDWEQV